MKTELIFSSTEENTLLKNAFLLAISFLISGQASASSRARNCVSNETPQIRAQMRLQSPYWVYEVDVSVNGFLGRASCADTGYGEMMNWRCSGQWQTGEPLTINMHKEKLVIRRPGNSSAQAAVLFCK